jgi:small subunit ribosomal protein S10
MMAVLKSPFTDKDAQEHFEVLVHKRLVDIIEPTGRTIDSLSNLELPAGVSIEIKM